MGADYDVIVIGSGFGGSVAALRLTEKGYRVGILEAGRRWAKDDFPRSNWNLRKFLWMPALGMRGIQRLTLLRDVLVLSGAGVGGGSLVYANTLYEPPEPFYRDPQWAHITDWRAELEPHYARAKRMLGVTEMPYETASDHVMKDLAQRLGVGDSYRPTPVGVFFGEAGMEVPDPYFGGEGPHRTGCTGCGGCMVGCRVGAKNTLDRNYLYLAEKNGAVIHAEHQVVDVIPVTGGYEVIAVRPGLTMRRRRVRFRASQIVLAAGALGTLRLLLDLRAVGRLSALSPRVGELVRTNSEAIVGATTTRSTDDYSRGVAITSSIHPNENTHIEPVRYPKGSNAMGLLATIMVDGDGRVPRQVRFAAQVIRHPIHFLRSLSVRRWSERTIILLVMQTLDNSIRVLRKRGLLRSRLTSRQGHGMPNPTYIPVANEAARATAGIIEGFPSSAWNEAILNIPTTAHIIGGATIGQTSETGVIDAYHRAFGHPGIHVVDGSAITANLGVNPSLTITAMAERALAMWPNAGEPDPRPPLGHEYRPIAPILPVRPAVPAGAPAAAFT